MTPKNGTDIRGHAYCNYYGSPGDQISLPVCEARSLRELGFLVDPSKIALAKIQTGKAPTLEASGVVVGVERGGVFRCGLT